MDLQRRIQSFLGTLSISEATEKSYAFAIKHFVKWMRANGFYNAGTACRFYKTALEREGHLSESTIKFYATVAKAYSRWLSETKMSDGYEVPDKAKLGMGMPIPPNKIMPSDLTFICSHLARRGPEGFRNRAILLLAVACGLTSEEICMVCANDLLVANGESWLTVRSSEDVHQMPVPDCVSQAILDYIAVRVAQSGDLPLFVQYKVGVATAMTPKQIGCAVSEALGVLRIKADEALPGDAQLAVITYLSRLRPDDRRRLASYASCLYYADMKL